MSAHVVAVRELRADVATTLTAAAIGAMRRAVASRGIVLAIVACQEAIRWANTLTTHDR